LPYKGDSYYFSNINANEKCITLNLKHERGKEIFLRLVKWADIFVENLGAGSMERLGLNYEALKKVNPKIIYASLKGYAPDSPQKDLPGQDYLGQAKSGMMDVGGFPGSPPMLSGAPVVDHHGGALLAFAIMCALYYRTQTGRGQFISIALMDAAIDLVWEQNMEYLAYGWIPRRRSANFFGGGLWGGMFNTGGAFKTKDGYVLIMTNDWQAICKAIGREELASDCRFDTPRKRIAWGPEFSMADEMHYVIEDWTKTKTRDEAISALRKVGVMCERVQSIPEVFEDPYVKDRKMKIFVEIEHPKMGKIILQRSPLNLSETPARITSPGPPLGSHNEEVFGKLLGYGEKEIATLKKERVI
jgi:crotonobetainyl-CoA:carnitine CoA-transferase CaiB-like acyl-CoA transferase